MVPATPLQAMRTYYDSGATRSYAFRRRQLELLRQAILLHDADINAALHTDLKKSPEETYVSETGLVLAAINQAIRRLRHWMKPQRAKTDLVNWPSTCRLHHDPLGVVFIIAPWNYPFQLLFVPLVGAIAGGNCAVLKPSELAPATAHIVATIIREIFSQDYLQVLEGEGSTVVPAVLGAFRFDHIFYTGSAAIGKAIYRQAAGDLIPVTLELGGKSPALIEADADLKIAARRIALAKYLNAGQTCVAPDYVLVHEDVRARFIDILRETLLAFYGENALQSDSYGKIINDRRFDTLAAYLAQGRVVIGGKTDRQALYLEPTVMEDVHPDAPLMTEEIFGPILPVFGFQTSAEALALIQRNPNPLAFYVFSSDSAKSKTWMEQVSFGGGCVNNATMHFANPHLPFGGVGNSGMGAYHGKYSFATFTHLKPVMTTPTWLDLKIKYPPFAGKMKWFKRLIR